MSHDYRSNRTNTRILRSLKRVKGGDILVFHDNHKTAARIEELIDKTITYLKENQLIYSRKWKASSKKSEIIQEKKQD